VLAFTERAAAREIEKLLKSAVANAEANHNLIGDDLVVKAAYVDEGPMIKRWRARARGRATQIRKRTCHITLTLVPAATATVTRALEPEAPAEEKPKRAPRRKAAPKGKPDAAETKAEQKPKAEAKPAAKRPVRGAKGTADEGEGSRGNREVSPGDETQSETKSRTTTRKKKTEEKDS
jgi:large subunit ribosomal protein L22